MMQTYEIGYLILPSIAESELGAVVDKIKDAVVKAGGTELEGEMPFKQPLAYTMTKTVGASRYVVSEAYLGWTKFDLPVDGAVALKVALDKTEEVLRFLLVKVPKETTFTFAKAKAAILELLAEREAARDEEEARVAVPAEEVVKSEQV